MEQLARVDLSETSVRLHAKLRRELGPDICACLVDPKVIEIMLNPNGVLWVERFGRGTERLGQMTASQAEASIATVAAMLRTTVDWFNPILECELPLDGSRFTAALPPLVKGPTFTIRRHAVAIFTLDDYVSQGVMTARQCAILGAAIEQRRNILIVGGTGSGKTTLVNAVIDHISRACPQDRPVIIEDTAEIQCSSENYVHLHANVRQPAQTCLSLTMRFRPDRIIVGEARGGEALTLIKAWNTGHPGGVATIHANSARAGLTRLEQLCAEATQAPQQKVIGEAIDIVVFIAKDSGAPAGRLVKEILRVHGFDGRDYVTSTEE